MTDRNRSLGQRFDAWLTRSYVWGPSRQKPPPPGPVPPEPTSPSDTPLALRAILFAGAVLLPLLVAALLIPLRTTLTASTLTLVMVLPVVAVAVVGHRRAAVVAGVTAALSYDILLTRPYYSVIIDTAEDVEAALVLGAIGTVVGTLVAKELDARTRAASRADEIAALAATAQAAMSGRHDHLVATATQGIETVLGARSCDWSPGFHGRVGQVMSRDGNFTDWTGAALPDGIVELPVQYAGRELGRLLVRNTGTEPVSSEERRAAIAIADILGAALNHSGA